ncbi:hypothetical protein GYB22_08765 [bacterium]|nr:hypothetical protein [bacterium]
MIIKKILSTLTLLLCVIIATAQPRSFSKKPEVFIVELNEYISTSSLKQNDDVIKLFTEKWNDSAFTDNEERTIIKVCNQMLMEEHSIENFVLFEETVMGGKDSVDAATFENWMEAIYPASKKENKTFTTLLIASRNLFYDNRIYQSSTKSWYSSVNSYTFDFKNDRVRISFENIDLICQADVDQLVIYETSGSYYLDTDVWEGNKGKVTWERVGYGPDNIYAEIQGTYSVRFDRAELEVDSVLFTNKDFLTEPILGSLRDRASSADHIEVDQLQNSPFPQFSSYRRDLTLGTYLEGQVRFKGGYAMKGAEIISRGTAYEPAIIEIDYKEKLKLEARSTSFSLKESRISSLKTEVTIFTDSGEIYHPNLLFNLNLGEKLLLLTRGDEGLQQSPFFDSDHMVEIYVDRVLWNLELPKIDFDMTVNESAAIIESADFYKEVRYEKIPRGMLAYHPLSKMRNYVVTYRVREFTFTEYAGWMGSKPTYLKPQIIELADLGYIFYNPDTDSIKVRAKLDHAVLSHMKLKDYDVIRFSSVIAARPNGYLSLINNQFTIEGVRAFRFSDSQSVYAFPHEQKVILKSKRRMEFGGRLTAGKFDFYSRAFEFDYFNFDINSNHIDSMRIYTEDLEGSNKLIAVKSVLRDINGTLEIDKSTNKSGLADHPEYPIFTSRKGAKIAYDKPNLFNGAYNEDEFYFEVDPFTIDSLDNFTTAGLKFPGTFVSAGIIPEFRYEASIQDDYSLGFERASPPEGYPMYGGSGHGDIDIKLSEEGFVAKGKIQFQGSEIISDDITMMPDSTITVAESYVINENDRYPNVYAENVTTRWLPKSDSLFVNTQGHEVTVLRDNQQFTGNLVQTSKELAGNGLLEWDIAKLKSKDLKFKPNMVDAEESAIELSTVSEDRIAFASDNVNSHVDFNTRIGEFKANEVGTLTRFPFNGYASTMDEYTWDMDAQTIELNNGPRLPATKSMFISQKYEQEGLKFQSTSALFNMLEGVIYADEVPYIDVADSRVFPFENKVVIEAEAVMRTLEQAKLLAARDNRYHEIFDARINVLGRYSLSGQGDYVYKDKHETGQVIHFNKLMVENDSTIIGEGYVKDSLSFTVSPKIAYKGFTHLSSQEEFIKFDGYVLPLHSFEEFPSTWFRYEQRPNPEYVVIPAKELLNEDRRKLYAAVSIANDSTHIYPTFVNFKRSYADMELTSDTGVMFYDEQEKTFFIGDSNKLFNGSPSGSFLSFNDATGGVFSEGRINFGMDVDENFSGVSAGNVEWQRGDSSFMVNMFMALNINLPPECYDRMIAVFEANSDDNPVANHDNVFTTRAVSELVSPKNYKEAISSLAQGQLEPQDELKRNLVLSKVSYHFSPTRNAFISLDPIQIAMINGTQINRTVDAKMAIVKRRSSIRYTIYIQVTKYDWFYIDYYNQTLYVTSTDKEFNEAIQLKGPKMSQGRFQVRTASSRTVTRFLEGLEPEE